MLKKVILTLAVVAFMGGFSYAITNPDTIDNVPGINFKTSTNVIVCYKYEDTGVATSQNYAIASKHTSGDTYYATSNMSTAIFKFTDATKKGTALSVTDDAITSLEAGDSLFNATLAYTAM